MGLINDIMNEVSKSLDDANDKRLQRRIIKKNKELKAFEKIGILVKERDIEALFWILTPEDHDKLNVRYGQFFYTPDLELRAVNVLGIMGNNTEIQKLKEIKSKTRNKVLSDAIEEVIYKRSPKYIKEKKDKIEKNWDDAKRKEEERIADAKRKEEKRIVKAKKKEKDETNLKEKIIRNGDMVIIDKFAKIYSDSYSEDEFRKLKELMKSKGYYINNNLLTSLILEYSGNHKYQSFKDKILNNSPEDVDQYLFNFVEMYGDNYKSKMGYLNTFLNEKNCKISRSKLDKELNQLLKQKELLEFEKHLLEEDGSLSIDDVDKLSGIEFETFTEILFKKMGYNTTKTKHSGDQGADLILEKFGIITVIQAKRHNNKITNSAIQEVVASIRHYDAHKGIVVTNNEFTNSAIELSVSNNIKLINRTKLNNLIKTHPIKRKNLETID